VRHRREFLKRTDRGVFSLQVEDVLNGAEAVRTVAGRVIRLEPVEAKVIVEVDYEHERERIAFDWVVVAAGFDPLWFSHLLGERARAALADAAGNGAAGRPPCRTSLERAIGHDLAVEGLHPRLHLPVLAGVAQGPGFPNLSCLGLLADRVLGAYAARPGGRRRPRDRRSRRPGPLGPVPSGSHRWAAIAGFVPGPHAVPPDRSHRQPARSARPCFNRAAEILTHERPSIDCVHLLK